MKLKKVKIFATICSLAMAIAMLGFATFAASTEVNTSSITGKISVAAADVDFKLTISDEEEGDILSEAEVADGAELATNAIAFDLDIESTVRTIEFTVERTDDYFMSYDLLVTFGIEFFDDIGTPADTDFTDCFTAEFDKSLAINGQSSDTATLTVTPLLAGIFALDEDISDFVYVITITASLNPV